MLNTELELGELGAFVRLPKAACFQTLHYPRARPLPVPWCDLRLLATANVAPLSSVWTRLPRMSLIIQKVSPLSFPPGDHSPRSKRKIHSVVPSLPHPSSLYNLTLVRSGSCGWEKLDSCYPATLLIFSFLLFVLVSWLVLLHTISVSLKNSFPSW